MWINNFKNTFLLLILTFFFNVIFSQNDSIKVTGSIIDAVTGESLNGIKVSIPGISSVSTDANGEFSILVANSKATLYISGMGYQIKEIPLKGKTEFKIKLYDESLNSVFDLYKMPYSNQSYSTLVNSVEMFNSSFTETSVSADDVLHSRVSGLNVINRSGVPGIGANMFLRGFSSIFATNQPLIIVDGMIYDNSEYSGSLISGYASNPLGNIDVKDIESMTIIKDGNSIYGSKAANGVILVNTVHPKEVTTYIDFYTHAGIKFKPEFLPMMDGYNFRSYLSEQLSSSGLSSDQIRQLPYMNDENSVEGYYRYHNNTNWQDEVFNNAIEQNYYLRVTGGDQIAKYGLSVGFLNSSGIVKETKLTRYNTRFNADVSVTSRFKINTNLAFTHNVHDLRDDGIAYYTSPIYLSLIKAPIFAPNIIDDQGQTTPVLEGYDSLLISNPAAIIQNMVGDVQNYRFFGSVGGKYTIIKGLTINTLFGINLDKKREDIFIPSNGVAPEMYMNYSIIKNSAKSIVDRYYSIYNDTWLNYIRSSNPNNYVSAILGVRYNTNETESDWGMAYNTPSDEVKDLGSGSELLRRTGGDLDIWKWMSIYSNAEYQLFYKYIVSANISFDGSSRFGSKAPGLNLLTNKFGVFPSIGAAWIISSEEFMASFDYFDLIKLRLSYGITGNDDIGNYGDTKYYTSQRFIGVVGSVRGNIPNPYIQWETNKKANIGLDLALLNERIRLSYDLYQNTTENMLAINELSYISGVDYIFTNDGSIINKGYEFNLEFRILNSQVNWDIGFGLAHYKNEITGLLEDFTTEIGNITIISQVGSPVGLFYGYKTKGVFISDEEAINSGLKQKLITGESVAFRGGDVIFDDYNEDGIIDQNDMQVIGDPNPDFTGMINSYAKWKNFSFDILFSFCYGNDVYNYLRANLESMNGFENQTIAVQNRWKADDQETDMPRAEWGDPMGNARFSDRWIEDGSYLRLKKVTLAYDLQFKNIFFRNAMIYISGYNLFTLSKYLGYDPEFSYSGSSLEQGIDFGLTPHTKSVFIGVKIGL